MLTLIDRLDVHGLTMFSATRKIFMTNLPKHVVVILFCSSHPFLKRDNVAQTSAQHAIKCKLSFTFTSMLGISHAGCFFIKLLKYHFVCQSDALGSAHLDIVDEPYVAEPGGDKQACRPVGFVERRQIGFGTKLEIFHVAEPGGQDCGLCFREDRAGGRPCG